ncbi:MAG: hypothetical protein BWK76_21915 [Desulfobulbaceae bacterium A2]|nr:MAG: hypothetical protein BWK76_21915 [Desulfobulbaceae bacterium A2]
MKRSRGNRRTLALTMIGLLLCLLPLESRGLATWADRLEIGPLRTLVLAGSNCLSCCTEPTALPRLRTVLVALVTPQAAPEAPGTDSSTMADSATEPREHSEAAASPAVSAAEEPTAEPDQGGNSGMASPAPPEEETPPSQEASMAVSEALPKPAVAVAPPAPKPTPVMAPGTEPETTVVLLGDSMMAVGLGPYLTRKLSAQPGVRVVRAYRSGTGLARPEVFNWVEQYPIMTGQIRPDLVICAMGANDAQDFLLNGKPVAFGSEPWNQAYLLRLEQLLKEAAPGDTPLLWLALPSMRSEKYSKKIKTLNGIVLEQLNRRGAVRWLESNPLLGGDQDTYVEFLNNGTNKLERLRQVDGIHVSDAGAKRIAPAILDWVAQQRQFRAPQTSSTSAGL